MARITNAVLAEKIDGLNNNVTGINTRLDTLNDRTFKNSTDIAKMKGVSGVIALVVSLGTTFLATYFGVKQ